MSETATSRCEYCGGDLSANALYCRNCLVPIAQPVPQRRPSTLSLLLGVSLIFGGPCAWVISGQLRSQFLRASISQATVHAASVPAAQAVDQADALIRSCGPANHDESTANNDPRPPIPFRVLAYNSQHLQFAFVPGGGAQIGDPPPYRWAFSGVLDSATNQRITLQQAAQRMNCAAPLAALVADAASHSASADDPPSASDASAPSASDPQ